MVAHIRGRLNTETSNINDLLTDIGRGEIKIPKFQRPFVWRAEQALALIDSFASGYPVGSVLLWKTAEKLRAERNIGEFALPETDDMTPTRYVLDGQQRLTVMYSSFGADLGAEGFSPIYDLNDEVFLESGETQLVHQFPLRLTYKTTELLNFRTALQSQEKGALFQQRLDALLGAITGYRLPVVELRDLTVEEVCPIFERINSSGTRLSTFDLIAAATWTTDFDLTDAADEISASIEPKNFDGISNDTTLKGLSAILLGSVKKEDILTLRSKPREDIAAATEKMKRSLLLTVDFLSTEYGMRSMAFLPYEAQLLCLVYIFSESDQLTVEEVGRTNQWFWRSSYSQHYRGASEAFISKSINAVTKYVKLGEGEASDFGAPPIADRFLINTFNFRSAMSKALVLTLASESPRNIVTGTSVDVGESLSVYNRRQFHHIFPQAFLKRNGIHANRINCLANICMLSAAENNHISDAKPNLYLPNAIRGLGDNAINVFESAILPVEDAATYELLDYDEFLIMRSRLLESKAAELCS